MKKLALLFLSISVLSSCGGDKKKGGEENTPVVKDNFSIVFQGTYEKDDEINLQYKKEGGYMDYDHPLLYKVTGQPNPQQFTIDLPEGLALENIQFYLSTNKEQKTVQLKNVSIMNNGKKVLDGDNFAYMKFFAGNPGVIMDEKNQRFNLNFEGKFPPGFTGNQELEALLVE